MDIAIVIAAAAGLIGGAWGFVADRIAARWPAHEDGSVRAVDWRTAAVMLAGGIAAAALSIRYLQDLSAFAYLAVIVAAMVLLFATDLDQRLLPDVVTYPLAAYGLVGFAVGIGPFVRTPGELLWATVAGIAVPVLLFVLSVPFGAGAIGIGDLKLLFGVGLIAGAQRVIATVIVGALAAAAGILVLIALRRITLKSYVPYGPFLIIGALWAMLVSAR